MTLPMGLSDVLTEYWPVLHRAVSQALGKPSRLPQLDPDTGLLDEGLWGVVYQVSPDRVIKVTTDEREADAVDDVMRAHRKLLWDHPGVVRFDAAWQLADQALSWEYGSYSHYTVYVFLREEVTPLDKLLPTEEFDRLCDALYPLREASLTYDYLLEKGERTLHQREQLVAEISMMIAQLKRRHRALWSALEFMKLYLGATDFALADVHAGNLGLALGAKHWSIFDLGHPETTSVTHEPGTTLFEVLEP